MYWSVIVHTGVYMHIMDYTYLVHTSMYWYIPLASTYQVHTSMYWFVLVHTGMYMHIMEYFRRTPQHGSTVERWRKVPCEHGLVVTLIGNLDFSTRYIPGQQLYRPICTEHWPVGSMLGYDTPIYHYKPVHTTLYIWSLSWGLVSLIFGKTGCMSLEWGCLHRFSHQLLWVQRPFSG